MYLLLTLFFISLVSLIFMIGRKLILTQNEYTTLITVDKSFLKSPHLEEWRYLTIKNLKKYSYMSLVGTIRFYVKSINFIKNKYNTVKTTIKYLYKTSGRIKEEEKKEVSNFLKMMSEYKRKIRRISHKIKQEENL